MPPTDKDCQEKWLEMERRMSTIETIIEEMKTNHLPHIVNSLAGLRQDIKDELQPIKAKMDHYRPPWGVVGLLTFLSSACVGLLVAFVMKSGG